MLGDLIPELTEHIATFLPLSDLRNLRLASRSLRANSARAFFDLAFHTVDTDLSTKSVGRLSRVSRHEEARVAVKTLRISASTRIGTYLGAGSSWARDPAGRLTPEQLAAIVGTLHAAATRFPNCRAYEMTDGELMLFEDKESPELTLTDALYIAHSVLAQPGVRLSSFTAELSSSDVYLYRRRLDPDLYTTPEFRASWAGLRDLALHYSLDSVVSPLLVTEAVNLQSLSLKDIVEGRPEGFARCLVAAPYLPPIRTLAVSLKVAQATLTALLARFQNTLTDLKFHNMRVQDNWRSLLLSDVADLPRLRRLTLMDLWEHSDPKCFCSLVEGDQEIPGLEFRTGWPTQNPEGPSYCVKGVRYTDQGSGMRGILEALVEAMECPVGNFSNELSEPRHDFSD